MLISIFSDDVKCKQVEVSDMRALGDAITDPAIHAWSPSVFKDGYRNLSNFISMELIALDVDEGMSLEEAKKAFAPYEHVIATTRNHQKEKVLKSGKRKPPADRFRIVLRLSRPITNQEEYYATFFHLRSLFPGIDPVCNNADRMFYPCNWPAEGDTEGKKIDPVAPAPKEDKPKRELSTGERGKLARSTLEFISIGVTENRNKSAFKAAKDFQEQGYSEDEAEERLSQCPTLGEPGFELKDLQKAIRQAYKKEPKYEPRQNSSPEASLAVGPRHSESLGASGPSGPAPGENFESLESLGLLEEALAHLANPEAVKGVSTGWKEVDELLGGLRQSELGIIQAYPKSGKTVLLTNMLANLTAQGLKVGFASLEMHPAKQVEPDLYSLLLKKDIRKGISDEDRNKLIGMLKGGRGLTYFKRVRRPTPDEICDWARKLYSVNGVRFFFIDHFHKFVPDEGSVASIQKTITALTGLKYECPEMFICLIVQPTKEQRDRNGVAERVGKNTLRGGASIFDECDWLINMHTKYNSYRIHETSWGDKREHFMASYPNDIRELEFEAIRAKPFSENMGQKLYMKYDKGTTEMKPFRWIQPDPERIEMENKGEGNGYRRGQQESYQKRPPSGWAQNTFERKKL